MKKILLLLILSVSLFGVDVNDDLRIRGFATLDATLNTSDDTRSVLPNGQSDILKKDEVNYNYSSIGAQLEYDLTDSIDFMAQGIYSKKDETSGYEASLDWLMLGYSFSDDYKLRIGKMKIPFMKGTEVTNINYSFLWTRPQVQSRGVNGFNELYGADLLKKTYIEDVDIEYQLTAGKAEHERGGEDNNYLYNFSALASYDDSWLRVSFGQLSFEHSTSDVIITFMSAETKVSFDSWLLYAGYGENQNNAIPNQKFIYGSLAYEFDKITPYILYSDNSVTSTQVYAPPPPGPPLPGPGTPVSNNGYTTTKSHAIGMRYDFYKDFAFKAQYNHETNERNEYVNRVEKSSSDIYTITLDMVF
jgi:hypothetical protein